MAVNDKSAGPRIGRPVAYYATANIPTPAVINQVNANGSVGLMTFPTTGPVQQSGVNFSPTQAVNSWGYFDFF